MESFYANTCHEKLLSGMKPALAFDPNGDYFSWKDKVRNKFHELLGDMPSKVPLNIRIELEKEEAEFFEKRIIIDVEENCSMPCHLLIPKKGKAPFPTLICLQGHSTGMHISLGRPVYDGDTSRYLSGADGDYGIQAVKEGYAVLALEQRGFGERKTDPSKVRGSTTCDHDAKVALLLGRTLIGERVWDISRAVDMLETFPQVDKDRIAVMGLSGGGTAAYYAGAIEPRLKAVMAAGAVCSLDQSIAYVNHCGCNYIPLMAKFFDMGEIASMIAPKKLIVVTGVEDPSFLLPGVQKVFSVIKKIYEKEGIPEDCRLIVGNGGHRFFADKCWKEFNKLFLGK